MDISGDYVFDAPQKAVWEALLDPNVLGSIMPGGKGFNKTGENQYNGVLEVKIGPVQGTFQGQIKLSDVKPPESYQMEVDGKGAPGFVKAVGKIHLESHDDHTHMQYSGQAQVGGRIASVGQRLMDSAARSIIRQSLDALNEYLKAQTGQQPTPAAAAPTADTNGAAPAASPMPAPSSFKPPSQTSLAVNVARDIFNDMVPAKYQPWVIGGIILVFLLIIWLIFKR